MLGFLWRALRAAADKWVEVNAARKGAALAYYSAFSLAPLLVVLVAVIGWLVGSDVADRYVESQLSGLMGASAAQTLHEAAARSNIEQSSLLATIVGLATTLLGATTVFAELQTQLNELWGVTAPKSQGVLGWLRQRVFSFGLVLALGFLLLVSLAISTVLAAVQPQLDDSSPLLAAASFVLDVGLSIAVTTIVFALVYRFLPAKRSPWWIVLRGGLLTAVLFYFGRLLISFYLAKSTMASAYGAAASFVVLLIWLYYSAQIFLFGAAFTTCLAATQRRTMT